MTALARSGHLWHDVPLTGMGSTVDATPGWLAEPIIIQTDWPL